MLERTLLEKIENQFFYPKDTILKTGFNNLDCFLQGLETDSIITIGGRASMGRTVFILSLLLNLLKDNKKCLYFSLENSAETVLKKLLVQLSEISFEILNQNSDDKQKYSEKFHSAIEQLEKMDLTIVDSFLDIKSIKEKIEIEKPDFVFIDYLQMINIPKNKKRLEYYEEILIDLKQLAHKNKCIMFIKSDISNNVEKRPDKRPQLSDLSKSGVIENLSDVVMFIYRNSYYPQKDSVEFDYSQDPTEIIIAKNKTGSIGMCTLFFNHEILKFEYPFPF